MAEMVQLIGDIVTALGASVPCAKVADYDSVTKLVTPLVAIKEIPTSTGVLLTAGDGTAQPYILRNEYTVEVYSKAKKQGDVYKTSAQTAKDLMAMVDSKLNTSFGLTMSGAPSVAPYPADLSVTRIVARYYCYIDTRNNEILRRI